MVPQQRAGEWIFRVFRRSLRAPLRGWAKRRARELARRGAKVAVFDRDIERGEKVAAEIGGVFCEVDVTSATRRSRRHSPRRAKLTARSACWSIAPASPMPPRPSAATRKPRRRSPIRSQQFELAIQINLIGTFRCIAQFGARNGRSRAPCRRREGRNHQHRLGRRRGRPDRPGGLFRIEGRGARDGAADRARPDERRHQGQHHPARRVQDADGGDDAAQRAGCARGAGAVPQAPRAAPRNMPGWPAS